MPVIKTIYDKTTHFLLRHDKITAWLLGMLTVGALPPFFQLWCLFPAFTGLALLGFKSERLRHLAAVGYWFGFGFFSVGFYWIGNALLVDAGQTGWLYPFVLFLNGAFFGLFTILPLVLMKLGKTPAAKVLFLTAGWFLSTEWLRSVFLTGFPWNALSSVLAFSPLWLQTLSWWGTYGLSMVVLLTAALPAVYINRPDKKNMYALVLPVLFIFLLFGCGKYLLARQEQSETGRQIRVRLVQPSISQSMKWRKGTAEKNLAEYINLSRAAGLENVDFVVWGETASPFNLVYDMEHRVLVQEAVPPQGYLLAGMLQDGYDGKTGDYVLYNSLAVMDYFGQIHDVYSKNHLVPFGEYIPLRQYLPQWIRPLTNMVGQFAKGEKYQTIKVDDYPEFAPLICYEIIFSGQIVRRQNKPKWAVVLTNDGWYGISAGPYQHLAAAQMRAAEEGMSVVRSANSGVSAVINPYGVITSRIGLAERGYVDDIVKTGLSHQTIFGQYGNLIPFLLSCFLMLLAGLFNCRNKA